MCADQSFAKYTVSEQDLTKLNFVRCIYYMHNVIQNKKLCNCLFEFNCKLLMQLPLEKEEIKKKKMWTRIVSLTWIHLLCS